MRPSGKTQYRLMDEADDARLRRLAKKHGMPVDGFDFPTVVAKRGRKIVGFLSTIPTKSAIVAGPLVVDLPIKGPVTMRLVECYEAVLRDAGVTSYVFAIPEDSVSWQRNAEEAFDLKPYARKDGHFWYVRRLNGQQGTERPGPVSH